MTKQGDPVLLAPCLRPRSAHDHNSITITCHRCDAIGFRRFRLHWWGHALPALGQRNFWHILRSAKSRIPIHFTKCTPPRAHSNTQQHIGITAAAADSQTNGDCQTRLTVSHASRTPERDERHRAAPARRSVFGARRSSFKSKNAEETGTMLEHPPWTW